MLIFVQIETHFWMKTRFQTEAQAHSELGRKANCLRKIRAIFLSNQKPKQNQSRLARIRYPARRTSFMYLLLVLIGFLVLLLRHSTGNRSYLF